MNIGLPIHSLLIVGSLSISAVFIASDALADIRYNPFEQPKITARETADPVRVLRERVDWQPVLRGVLVAGPNSVADLGGLVLQIGESARGYRLLSVREGAATFNRNGEIITISVYEQELSEEDDE